MSGPFTLSHTKFEEIGILSHTKFGEIGTLSHTKFGKIGTLSHTKFWKIGILSHTKFWKIGILSHIKFHILLHPYLSLKRYPFHIPFSKKGPISHTTSLKKGTLSRSWSPKMYHFRAEHPCIVHYRGTSPPPPRVKQTNKQATKQQMSWLQHCFSVSEINLVFISLFKSYSFLLTSTI